MAVSTSALTVYAPVMRGIIWLQTRRTVTLKIAKCLNRHTAHQVSVEKKPQSENKRIKLESKGGLFFR